MTIKEAWYEIFLVFATPREERDEWQRRLTGLDFTEGGEGICHAIDKLYDAKKIKERTTYLMYDKISWQIWGTYFYPRTPDNDILRACYCYFEYLDAEAL